MRFSKETRVTIGVLTLCAAGFVWVNLFTDGGLTADIATTVTSTVATTALAQEAPLLSEAQTQETGEGTGGTGGLVDEVAVTPDVVALSLSSTPEGATVLLDGEALEGVTPLSEAPVAGTEEARLRVELSGYLPYEGPLSLTFNRNISVYLEPLPQGAASGGAVAEGAIADAASGGAPENLSESPFVNVAGADTVSSGTMVAREVIIDELPFLITAPPQKAEELDEEEDQTAARPEGERRASVNPFSPLVLRVEVPEEAPFTQSEELIVVPVPDGTAPTGARGESVVSVAPAPREPVRAPAPRPVAPPAPRTTQLPRALPQGSLPTAPRILERRVRAPQPDLTAIAAIRVPEVSNAGALAVAPVASQVTTADASAASEAMLEPLALAKQNALGGGAPLFAGTNELSRFLRDHGVSFTGTVPGPVGVGVFRYADLSAPVVVALGDTLPDTDIVLSNLSGAKAEFTQGTLSQTLDRR